MRQRIGAAALITTLLLPVAGPTSAQDQPWQQQLSQQLENLDGRFHENDFATIETRTGLVDAGASQTVSMELKPGSYMVVTVCDNDCSDVDLSVSHDGSVLDQDALADDVPIVDFDAPQAGSYRFEVTMVSCSTPTCGYGLIAAGANERVARTLALGSYLATAVCDNDCSDVDLILYDAAGNKLGEDVLADDVPVVDFLGPGSFQFEVRMVSCSTPTCGYGLRIYRKD